MMFLVSIAPLITDIPIVAITLLILQSASENDIVFGGIHLFGGAYLIWLALNDLFSKAVQINSEVSDKNSLLKGIIINFLNPHPYIFWLSIGGTMVTKGWQNHPYYALAFIIVFYLLLVGSKVVLVFGVYKIKHLLNTTWYLLIIKSLSIFLIVFAVYLITDGLKLLGLL